MTLSDRVLISADVMAREIGDETVILDLKRGAYFGLEAVGSRIWRLLAAGKTLGEVCDAVETEFDVRRDTLEADALELVAQLRREGLVSVCAGVTAVQAEEERS